MHRPGTINNQPASVQQRISRSLEAASVRSCSACGLRLSFLRFRTSTTKKTHTKKPPDLLQFDLKVSFQD
ncbi:hypothetical protein E4T56_gene4789 [Termitomyces sp. T112]|nr:hypothetical protein E4T56_gene4789 [Termitomyces sp. T112]